MDHTPFLTAFPGCADFSELCGGLKNAYITAVQVSEAERTISVSAWFPAMPSPVETSSLSERIRSDYDLRSVSLQPDFPKPVSSVTEAAGIPGSAVGVPQPAGSVLYGRSIRQTPVPMSSLTLESGRVTVEGDVFAVSSRALQKRGGAVLSFDMTDRTNSIRVSRYLRSEDDQSILDKIKEGDHLTVQGEISYSKFDDDMVLDPRNIVKGKKTVRPDNAPEKRVELHMHTRFSALDALTDPEALIKRAAYWGMPAVAVTDHGVAQAFPDMWKYGKKNGVKVIYGLEAYYYEDARKVFHGDSDLPLDTETVAFDIETTGLNESTDRITEIGAVIYAGGEIRDSFQTFVNPGMPIPQEITDLTGITDADVASAPGEKEALEAFLRFAGGRPLAAHNADFDTGFMRAAAARNGMTFDFPYIDTLVAAHHLLPELTRFKLDTVSNHLKLPKFNHHRASDDAAVVARIMEKFIPMMQERGIRDLNGINRLCEDNTRAEKTFHMILLVKNRTGLKNLYKLISSSYLEHFYRTPNIPRSLLETHRDGLLVGSACGMGELYGAVMRGESEEKLKEIASFYDYLEIQPICNNAFLIEDGRVSGEEVLQDYNRTILRLGRELGKPVIAASDVHFLDPEDEQYRRILLAAKKFSDPDRECPIYFRNTEEMLAEFQYLGEETAREVVITNTRAIADQIEEIELLPKGLFPPKIENSAEELKNLVYGKMHRVYGEVPPPVVQERVDTELKTILDHHYDVIYMSAQKLVQNSLEHGYLVGSRGSVGSSMAAWMSGITEVNSFPAHYVCPQCCYSEFPSLKLCWNPHAEAGHEADLSASMFTEELPAYGCGADMPEKNCPLCGTPLRRDGFDIPFETFLGYPGNEKTPDIDLNFSGEYQAKAHKYTETLFGSDHVFRAGTIGTLAEKTAYGYVKKYLEERGIKATRAEENRLAAGLVGIKRTTGQHPGGLVVIPQDKDVTDFCPVQHPADDPNSDIITTHFEYHCMEDNLLKLDELGHDDPTMIRMMEDMTGVNAREISLSDPETMSIYTSPAALGLPDDDPIIGKTGTIGVPEFGTGFTRQMLVDTQPKLFDTLVRLSGFSHGTDVWAGNIHDLIVSGTATVDETIGCRDDIMIYLIGLGMEPSLAFQTMESVRKGKVKKSGKFPGDAEQQMKDLGVPAWWVESARKIAYLFPKAHAVAYVMMAFRIAWFKVHEPLAFYSAYFYRRSQKGGFDIEMMGGGTERVRRKINEMKRASTLTANEEDLLVTLEAVYEFNLRGFRFAPIDFQHSDAIRFLITDDRTILPPFVSVPGLGETAAWDLAHCRESGREFISIDEIGSACPKVSQTHLETLKRMGAFGDLPDSSQVSLFDDW
ncbi:MAG: DNA polymerase III subunit alpha [Oscillospiraceae bacterium]|nr:DNA polymerase III subunit alpha [Oscillospiraceae bacterium]